MNLSVTLRPWQPSDLDNLVSFANNPNIARYLTDAFPYPYTRATGEGFIAFANKGNPVHIFAIDVDGVAAGGIGVHPQHDIMRKNAELGYWLAEPFWGKGIITLAVTKMIDFAFTTYDITRLFARPFGNNPASMRVLQKAGFRLEAIIEKSIYKNGEFLDEHIYAIRRHAWEKQNKNT